MKIVNATRNTTLAEQFEECKTFWEQTKGMMFREKVEPLLFEFPKPQRVHLHSWFCPDSIDLVFLDDSWEVIEIKSEWEKRCAYSSKWECSFLLELPAGTIAQSRTQVGDILHILKK